jgi:hypothetical protein
MLASLRPPQYGGSGTLPFAVNNDAHLVRVRQAETETTTAQQLWTLTVSIQQEHFGEGVLEATVNAGAKTYSPEEIASLRAGRILLNDPPPLTGQGFGQEHMLEGFIEGSMSRFPARECVVRTVYASHRSHPHWKDFARLRAVFLLKATGTVEHILQLGIGAVRAGHVAITFRGRRQARYSNVGPATIELKGSCPLD